MMCSAHPEGDDLSHWWSGLCSSSIQMHTITYYEALYFLWAQTFSGKPSSELMTWHHPLLHLDITIFYIHISLSQFSPAGILFDSRAWLSFFRTVHELSLIVVVLCSWCWCLSEVFTIHWIKRIDCWSIGWMDGCMTGCMDGGMNTCLHNWMNNCIGGWMEAWINRWLQDWWKHERPCKSMS